jgi:cell division protein FtsB
MAFVKDIRTYARQVVGPTLAVSLFAYFAYHAIEGDRGLLAWMQLTQDVEATQAELDKMVHTREALDHQTNLLRSEALDPDMLDERARAVLGLVRKDDIIIAVPTAGLDHESDAFPAQDRILTLALDTHR